MTLRIFDDVLADIKTMLPSAIICKKYDIKYGEYLAHLGAFVEISNGIALDVIQNNLGGRGDLVTVVVKPDLPHPVSEVNKPCCGGGVVR